MLAIDSNSANFSYNLVNVIRAVIRWIATLTTSIIHFGVCGTALGAAAKTGTQNTLADLGIGFITATPDGDGVVRR